MIVTIEELKSFPEFVGLSDASLMRKIKSIEERIRRFTNNDFQNRNKQIEASVVGGKICANSIHLKVGDTVQIGKSSINEGLFTIVSIDRTHNLIEVDEELCDCDYNCITKVEYPADVVEGAIEMLKYDINNADKVNVQSETLSRHSITYIAQTDANTIMGYPKQLGAFLKHYARART